MPNLTISNTSPLLYLHAIGQLELLRLLYQNIVIPKAVQSELAVGALQGINVPDPLQIPTKSPKVFKPKGFFLFSIPNPAQKIKNEILVPGS